MEEKLIEILTSIQSGVAKAGDFAIGQLPDVAQTAVAFGRAWNTIGFAILALLTIAVAVVAYKLFKFLLSKHKPNSYGSEDKSFEMGLVAIFGSACALLSSMAAMAMLKQTLLVWLAPKLWLIAELAKLVK